MKKYLVIFFVLLNMFPYPVIADEPKFSVSVENIYKISPDGTAAVTQNFILTNLTSDYFPQEFVLPKLDPSVTNLQAVDRLGPIPISQNMVKFNDQVVGQGKILRWTLNYHSKKIAQRVGRLWQIIIPASPPLPGQTSSATRIILPTEFGKQVLAKPKPNSDELFWQDTPKSPIILIFDPNSEEVPYQAIDFTARYHLYNSRLYPVSTSLYLPADTQFQKVFIDGLNPKPSTVTSDSSGNWQAQYSLGPAGKLDVTINGSAALFLQPIFNQEIASLPNNPNRYWPTTDPVMMKISQDFTTSQQVYNYVISNLEYLPNSTKYQRLGARGAMQSPKNATSLEFSDLFVTLAKAANIPTQEVFGFLVDNPENLHTWVETYDQSQKSWIMADPTLARISNLDYSSSLDFNHLVIAQSNDGVVIPVIPTLEFKAVAKDLDILKTPKVTANLNLPAKITSGFAGNGTLFLENHGPTSFLPDTVSLTATKFDLEQRVFLTSKIPPFGNQKFPVKILPPTWFRQVSDIITLKFGTQSENYPVESQPIYKNIWLTLFIFLLILGLISLFAQITRSLSLQKR